MAFPNEAGANESTVGLWVYCTQWRRPMGRNLPNLRACCKHIDCVEILSRLVMTLCLLYFYDIRQVRGRGGNLSTRLGYASVSKIWVADVIGSTNLHAKTRAPSRCIAASLFPRSILIVGLYIVYWKEYI